MAVYSGHSPGDHEVVGRINSEHLSDQFQRDLGHAADNDLLHDGEVKLDDIHSASGSGIAALSGAQQTAVRTRPDTDMLATMDDSDESWLVASPYTSPRSAATAEVNDAPPASKQADRPASRMERAPSRALTQAYAQPSKIPRLMPGSTVQRQPSAGPSSRGGLASASPVTRSRSGMADDSRTAAPSKAKVVKPAVASPPRSVSDTAEDGQPVWRNVSKAPAPKYTQQTDAALGGPFERTGSTQLPKAGSTQLTRANSAKPRTRTKPARSQGSRPNSAKDQTPNGTAAAVTTANPQEPQLIQEQQLFLPFQSRIPAAPAQSASAEPDTSGISASDGRTGLAQPETLQAAEADQAAAQQAENSQPQAQAQPNEQLSNTTEAAGTAEIASKPPEEAHQAQNGHAHPNAPVSTEHIEVSMPEGAEAGVPHKPSLQDEKINKKCCCCVIM